MCGENLEVAAVPESRAEGVRSGGGGWGGGVQNSTVEPETDGPVLYLFGIDANVTGGSHPRCATGGDPAPDRKAAVAEPS